MNLRKQMVAIVLGILIAVSPGTLGAFTPNDTYWDDDPATTEEDEDKQWTLEQINIDDAWDPTDTSEFTNPGANTINVAVIDSGLCSSHLDLYKRLWVNPDDNNLDDFDDDGNGKPDDINGWDFFDSWDDTTNTRFQDNHPLDGWQSKAGVADHGTAVTGIIAAEIDNDRGVAGCADVSIMVLKVYDLSNPFQWKMDSSDRGIYNGEVKEAVGEAIQYAIDEGADIISMSLGFDSADPVIKSNLESAYYDNNMLIVASAGNHGSSPLTYPAQWDFVTAVGAVDQNNNRVQGDGWGSNYGTMLDLMAPTGPFYDESGSVPPDVTIYTTKGFHDEDEGDVPLHDFYEEYRWFTGTSGAAPHVSGTAALLWSMRPEMTNYQLQRLMEVTATDLGTPGWSQWTGYGLIDAEEAVEHINHFQDSWSEPRDISLDGDASGCQELYDYGMEIDTLGATHIVYSPKGGSTHGLYYMQIDKSGTIRYHNRIMNLGNAPIIELDIYVDVLSRCHAFFLFESGGNSFLAYAYFFLDQWGDLSKSTNFPSYVAVDSEIDTFKDLNIVCTDADDDPNHILPIVGCMEEDTDDDYLIRIMELDIYGNLDQNHYIDPLDSVECLDLDIWKDFPPLVVIGYQSGKEGYIQHFDPWQDVFHPESNTFNNEASGTSDIQLSTFSPGGQTSVIFHEPEKDHSYFRCWYGDFMEYEPTPEIGDDGWMGPEESDLSLCTDWLEVNHIVWKEYNTGTHEYAMKFASMTRFGYDYFTTKKMSGSTPSVSYERELLPYNDNVLDRPIIRSYSPLFFGEPDDELRVLVFDQTVKKFKYMTTMSNYKSQSMIVASYQDDRLQDIGLDEDGYVHMIWEKYDPNTQASKVHYNFWDENNQPVLTQDLTANSELLIDGIIQSLAPRLIVIQTTQGDTHVLMFWLGQDNLDRYRLCYSRIKIDFTNPNKYQFEVQPKIIKWYGDEIEWYEVEYDSRHDLVHLVYLGQDNVFSNQEINYIIMDPSNGNRDMEKMLDILNGIDIDQIQMDLDPYMYPYIVFSKGYDVFLIHYEFDWDNIDIQLLFKKEKIQDFIPGQEAVGGHHPEIRVDDDIQVNSKLEIGNEFEVDYEYWNYQYFGWTDKNDRFVHVFIPLVDNNGVLTHKIRYLKISMRDQTTFDIAIDSIIYTYMGSRFSDDYGNMEVLMDNENRPYLVYLDPGGADAIYLIKIDNFGREIMSEVLISRNTYGSTSKDMVHPQLAYFFDDELDEFNIAISWMEKLYYGSTHEIYLRRSMTYSL